MPTAATWRSRLVGRGRGRVVASVGAFASVGVVASVAVFASLAFAVGCGQGGAPAAPDAGDAGDAGTGVAVPEGGTSGGTCAVNADCADSAAAQAIQNTRCIGLEIYCLAGQCHGDCGDSCTAVRTDVDPCPAPRLCAPAKSVCAIVPIRCQGANDCPVYLPPTADGGTAAWVCDAGICAYPGFQYATQ
jgi:hypothetical protein